MKAVQFAEYGGPEVLRVVDVPPPHPGPGEVRIAARAAGVNGLEWKIRQGLLRDQIPVTLPCGVGGDAAGVVDEVGDGVDDLDVGDTVFGSGSATYAEHAVLTSWAPMPPAVSFEEAAGFPVPFETAFRVLDAVDVRPGRTLLINGASGGVGSVALQIAVHRGVQVIGIAGADNQDYLASLGAIPTTYGEGLVDRVRRLDVSRVDGALDIAGSGVIPDLITLTGDASRVVSIADFGAPRYGARVSTGFGGDKSPALRAGADLVAAGVLTLPVARTFPLTDAGAAQAESARGHVRGRLVVSVP